MKYNMIRNFSIAICALSIFTNELFMTRAYAEDDTTTTEQNESYNLNQDTVNMKISMNSSSKFENVSVQGLKNVIVYGDKCKLKILANDKYYENIKWRNSDTSAAIINSDGSLMAIANGKAVVFGDICDDNDKVIGTVELSFYVKGYGNLTGWIQNDETWYYRNPTNLTLKTGWITLNGDWYSLDENGAMKTGWVEDHDNLYFLRKDSGAMARGWFKDDGSWYYAENNGELKKGWFRDHGNIYYLNEDGKMQTTEKRIDGKEYDFASNGELLTVDN